jgi:hypothetical protein
VVRDTVNEKKRKRKIESSDTSALSTSLYNFERNKGMPTSTRFDRSDGQKTRSMVSTTRSGLIRYTESILTNIQKRRKYTKKSPSIMKSPATIAKDDGDDHGDNDYGDDDVEEIKWAFFFHLVLQDDTANNVEVIVSHKVCYCVIRLL